MKKSNKNIKRIISMCLTILYCLSIMTTVFATSAILGSYAEVTPGLKGVDGSTHVTTMASDYLALIQYVGWAIAIGMIIYIGIKYMMSAANERADLKSGTIRYIIGAIMIGAASTVFPILWAIASTAGE